MTSGRIIATLTLLILLTSTANAETIYKQVNNEFSFSDLFLSASFDTFSQKVLMRPGDDLEFRYSLDYDIEPYDTYSGLRVMTKAQYNDPNCKPILDRLEQVKIFQSSGFAFPTNKYLSPSDLNENYNCGTVHYTSDPNPPSTSDVFFEDGVWQGERNIVVDPQDLSLSGEYFVMGGYCSWHDDSYIADTLTCSNDAVWINVVGDDYCGTGDGYQPITPVDDPDGYCWSERGRKLCIDSKCRDPCGGVTGSGRCSDCIADDIRTKDQALDLRDELGYSSSTIFCLPEESCETVDDCKSLSWVADITGLNELDETLVNEKLKLRDGFGNGAHCEKDNPTNSKIKAANEVFDSVAKYGQCMPGAKRVQDCYDIFGTPTAARYVDVKGFRHEGRSWSINANDECVIDECTDAMDPKCVLYEPSGASKIGVCNTIEYKSGACTSNNMLDYCGTQCSFKDTPNPLTTCNTDTDCGVVDNFFMKCVKDPSGVGSCIKGEQPAPSDFNDVCDSRSYCMDRFWTVLDRCEDVKCGDDGSCEIIETTCVSDADCQTDTNFARVCENGCCASGDIPTPVQSCNNGVQDAGELGVDCGGVCGNLCSLPVECISSTSSVSCFMDEYAFESLMAIAGIFGIILVSLTVYAGKKGWITI